MAKKQKRRYRGLSTVRFGGLIPHMNRSLNGKEVATGAAIGVAVALASRWARNTVAPASWKAKALTTATDPATGQPVGGFNVWSFVHDNLPALFALGASAGLYYGMRKKNESRAFSMATGAGVIGISKLGFDVVQNVLPASFKGLVAVRVGGQMRGIVVPDANRQAMRGLIVQSPAHSIHPGTASRVSNVQRAALGALSRRRAA